MLPKDPSRNAITRRPAHVAETSPVRAFQPSRRFSRWNGRFLGHPRVAHVFREVLQALPASGATPAGTGSITLLSSVERGNGTTTVALGLAAVAGGSRASRAVVVETNTYAPALSRILGCSPSPGLSEWLAGVVDGNRAIRFVEPHAFAVVPIGGGGPADPEIFESVRFRNLMQELKGRFDRVILDVAPITSSVDAKVLASVADHMLLVVAADRTSREAAEHACRLASQAGTHFAGVILNRRRYAIPRWLYRSL
ncbi:MAG: CpsD/CapB family tyrosine-protein kinase [Planctomycetota bacterium]